MLLVFDFSPRDSIGAPLLCAAKRGRVELQIPTFGILEETLISASPNLT